MTYLIGNNCHDFVSFYFNLPSHNYLESTSREEIQLRGCLEVTLRLERCALNFTATEHYMFIRSQLSQFHAANLRAHCNIKVLQWQNLHPDQEHHEKLRVIKMQ